MLTLKEVKELIPGDRIYVARQISMGSTVESYAEVRGSGTVSLTQTHKCLIVKSEDTRSVYELPYENYGAAWAVYKSADDRGLDLLINVD